MKPEQCPRLFRIPANRVWRTYLGGKTLDSLAGNPAPADSHFPEDWILSTTPARNIGREELADEGLSSLESQGECRTLESWLDEYPHEILGERHLREFGKSAGFLLKFLDSSIRLHMQCHPTAEFSRRFLNSNSGKTEGYVILGHRPDVTPYLYLGFQRPPERDAFREAIRNQDSKSILAGFDKIPVQPGDMFLVPGGVPHAIGEGIFMIEIMEPTDFAVRIEFERGGYVLPEQARFMGRDVDFALSMFDFSPRSPEQVRRDFFIVPEPLPVEGDAERFSLFDARKTDCFRVERLQIHGTAQYETADCFRACIVTRGDGSIRADGETLELHPYDRILIPAQTERVRIEGNLEIITALPPQKQKKK